MPIDRVVTSFLHLLLDCAADRLDQRLVIVRLGHVEVVGGNGWDVFVGLMTERQRPECGCVEEEEKKSRLTA